MYTYNMLDILVTQQIKTVSIERCFPPVWLEMSSLALGFLSLQSRELLSPTYKYSIHYTL